MNKKLVGERWVTLDITSFENYDDHQKDIKLQDQVNSDNKDRVLMLKGLSYTAVNDDILKFFKDYKL